MPSPRENTIVRSILDYLNSLPNCYARKRYANPMTGAGEPDITACLWGRRLEFEVKRPGGKATPRQEAELYKWHDAGAVAAVVTSVEDVRRCLEAFASEGGPSATI